MIFKKWLCYVKYVIDRRNKLTLALKYQRYISINKVNFNIC